MKVGEKVAWWASKVLLLIIFAGGIPKKIFGFSGTTDYMASVGVPLPSLSLIIAIGLLIFGTVTVLIERYFLFGIGALLLFLFLATIFFHNPITQENQEIAFMKNLAIGGGWIALALAYRWRPKASSPAA